MVEFIGAPGSGKSTLLTVVRDSCEGAGLSPATVVEASRLLASRSRLGRLAAARLEGRTRDRFLWMLFRWASGVAAVGHVVATWPLAWRVLRSQLGRPPGADAGERRVLYWFFRLLGAHALFLARAQPGEVLLLDEGYLHRVVQLFASSVERPQPSVVGRYLDAVPAPDLVVVVGAPADRCLERVRQRGVWPRLNGRDDDELEEFVHNAHRAAAIAADHVRDRGWDRIEVDNGANGRVGRAELHRALGTWLGDDAGVPR